MKGKSLAIMVAAAAVVGGVGIYFYTSSGNSWRDSGNVAPGTKVLQLEPEKVGQVIIKTHAAQLHLIKKGEEWTVQERGGYPASTENVNKLLLKAWEMKALQEVKVGASQFGRLELEAPEKDAGSGTLIEFKDGNGAPLAGMMAGKRYMKKAGEEVNPMGLDTPGGYAAGRYVMPTSAGAKVWLVSETLEAAAPTPDQWLNHDFIKPGNIVGLALAGSTPERHWKLTRTDAASPTWTLEGAKPEETLDSGKVSPLATVLTSPGFTDVLAPDAKPADTGLDKPEVLTVETTDHITYTLKVGKLTGENYPVTVEVAYNPAKERTTGKDEKPEDKAKLEEDFKKAQKAAQEKFEGEKKYQGRPYLVSKFTVEQLVKDRSSFMQEKKPEGVAPGVGPSGAPAPLFPAPGAMVPPNGGAPRRPISVATPPVSVPANPAPAPAPAPEAVKPQPKPPVVNPPKAAEDAKPAAESKPAAAPGKPADAGKKPN